MSDEIREDDNHQEPTSNINNKPGDESFSIVVFLWEVFKVVIISLVIIVPIRYYLVQPFFVKGPSMETNFHDKDYLIVDEIGYRLSDPKRGDVIIFRYPEDPKQFFIKRIIALPDEEILVQNNQVKIFNADSPEGFVLSEGYLDECQESDGYILIKLYEN